MSEKAFDIQEYMIHGVERVVKEAIKATLKNPKESMFMEDHPGGCVLHEKRSLVESLLQKQR